VAAKEVIEDLLTGKIEKSGKIGQIGATVHYDFDNLIVHWPEARFIHLLRDPRDVAQSILERKWAGHLYKAATWWPTAELCWERLVSKLRENQFIEIRYEALLAEPEKELSRLCAFLGLTYNASMMDYTKTAIQYPKPNPSLGLRWMQKLSTREVALAECMAGDLLTKRGYRHEAEPATISHTQHLYYTMYSKAIFFRYRIGKFGLVIAVADIIGRRLGFRTLAKYARAKISAVLESDLIEEAAGYTSPSANILPVLLPVPKTVLMGSK
jgi:hypothetical protein